MRVSAALFVVFVAASFGQAHGAEIKAASKLSAVTVFPSGAEITRTATVTLPKGANVVLFADLPAGAVQSSIRVTGRSSGALEIGSVDTRRVFVPRADAATAASERKRLEDEIERLKDDAERIKAEIQAAETQKELINNLAQLPVRPVAPGAAAAAVDWGQVFTLIGARMSEVHAAILKARIVLRETGRKIKDLAGKLAALAPKQEQRTEVKLHVVAAAPLEAELTILYQVRRASWQPLYDARLVTGAKSVAPKLTLVRRASVSQRSGEDWDKVALALSTTRPSGATSAPKLFPLSVDFMPDLPPAPPRPMAMESSRPRSFADKDEAEADTKPLGGAIRKRRKLKARVRERGARTRAAPFQATFIVPGRQSIAATGEVKRVRIGDSALEPALIVRTVPKRRRQAFLYAKLKLPKGAAFLPGRVLLFRDATFVGTGRLPLLRPGQDHELGFGPDDKVQVKYAVVTEKRGESGLITSSKTDQRNFKITVRNLHERAIDITVRDQLPFSKNQDIRVDLIGRSVPTRRNIDDKQGVLGWEMKLPAGDEQVIEFGYKVTWPGAKKIIYGR